MEMQAVSEVPRCELSDAPSVLRKPNPAETYHLLGCCSGKHGKQHDSDDQLGGSHSDCGLLNSCAGQN
jgi:hypothetical protein